MWILTQDQMDLINCDHIWADNNKILGIRGGGKDYGEFVTLGTYETSERAQKVLFNIFSVKRKKHFSFIMPEK